MALSAEGRTRLVHSAMAADIEKRRLLGLDIQGQGRARAQIENAFEAAFPRPQQNFQPVPSKAIRNGWP